MRKTSIMLGVMLLAGLALGMVAGPMLGGTASAQTQPVAPAQQGAASDTLRTLFLDKLAAALNIQRSALDSTITSAGTSAVDTAVQQGTITQAEATALKARIQAGDVGVLFGGRGGRGGPGGVRVEGLQEAMLDAAAAKLTITRDELVAQLRSGQTLDQLAAAHNTTAQAVVDAALAAAKTKLAAAVTAGTITQAQADALYAQLQQRGAQLFTHGGHGGRGVPGGPQAPRQPRTTTTPTTAPSA